MTTTEKIRIEAHRIRNAARKHYGTVGGDIDFISCWNMARLGQELPWETEMEEDTEKFYGIKITEDKIQPPRGSFRVIEGDLESAILAGLGVYHTHNGYSIVCKDNRAVAVKTHGTGWCNRCQSYCFGDCQAN